MQLIWSAVISEFYGYFVFFHHGNLVAEQLTVTRQLWEGALGKYDNWCLFIVIEICSTAQWNTTPQRLWLAAPGSKTSKIIQINTASSAIQPYPDVLHKNSCQLPQQKSVSDFEYFPRYVCMCGWICVPRTHAASGGTGQREVTYLYINILHIYSYSSHTLLLLITLPLFFFKKL